MTSAMWFVWLLRDDIRGSAEPSGVMAQRAFLSWWLLWGRNEYPAIFSWTQEHGEIAMQPVPLENGLRCPDLLVRLHNARNDLKDAFPLGDAESLAEYFCWYRINAPGELAAAPSLPADALAITEEHCPSDRAAAGDAWLPRIAIALSRSIPGLESGGIRDPDTRRRFAAWFRDSGHALIPQPSAPVAARPETRRRRSLRSDGVNLIGFINRQSGLGEDARAMSMALSAVGVPHALIDVGGDPPAMQPLAISDHPVFETSIYCMSAFDMATLYARRGAAFFAGQYRIGYWPWELHRFPDLWTAVYELVDEIWTGSAFTANAYRANCPKPVTCLPAPVVVPVVRRHGLPMVNKDAFVFTYPFDPNSYLARKNPIALVRAFHLAFPPEDRKAALLLRVNGTLSKGQDRSSLLAETANDRRIVIMEGTLGRIDSLAMTASCDCLVSPHRAEGYGRNIAEAILLGVPVLATGYSGCEDFLAPDERIAFEPKQVAAGEYPFGGGLLWAEPVIADMAAKMQLTRDRMRRHARQERKRLVARTAQFAAACSPQVAGQAIVDRLTAQHLIGRRNRTKLAPSLTP